MLALVVLTVPAGLWYYEREECVVGKPVAHSWTLIPLALMNQPYGGSAMFWTSTSTFEFDSGSLRLTSSPWDTGGSASLGPNYPPYSRLPMGGFDASNWTIYATQNETQFTGEPNGGCTSPYVASTAPQAIGAGYFLPITISLPNLTTDANESHYGSEGIPNSPGIPRMWFDNGLHAPNRPAINTCTATTNTTLSVTGEVHVPVALSLSVGDHNVTAYGTLSWIEVPNFDPTLVSYGNASLTYVFPPLGVWDVYSYSGSSATGALAFQYHPC